MRRDFAAANGKRSVEQADLDKYRRLVPVDVLVRDLLNRSRIGAGYRMFAS